MIQRKYLILLALGSFIIALDQLTKLYIHTQFSLGESLPVISNYFDITYVRNTGAAFGIFRELPEFWHTLFFMSVPPLAVLIVFLMLRSLPESETTQIVALSCIFGGAIGNYIDRIRFGYVIDFLDFHIQNRWSWPAFNVADSAIVGGVGLLVILIIKQIAEERAQKKQAAKSA